MDWKKWYFRNIKNKRLEIRLRLRVAWTMLRFIFSAVSTPPDEDGSADLSYVLEVARTIGHMNQYKLVVTKEHGSCKYCAQSFVPLYREELDKRGGEH